MDHLPKVEAEYFETNDLTPEKRLLREVFLRSLADLNSHIPRDVRLEAIEWFEDIGAPVNPVIKGAFSFNFICEVFDFSDKRIATIMQLVAEAKAALDTMVPAEPGYRFKAHVHSLKGREYVC